MIGNIVFGIGRHNTPDFPCSMEANILICRPQSNVIFALYIGKKDSKCLHNILDFAKIISLPAISLFCTIIEMIKSSNDNNIGRNYDLIKSNKGK